LRKAIIKKTKFGVEEGLEALNNFGTLNKQILHYSILFLVHVT